MKLTKLIIVLFVYFFIVAYNNIQETKINKYYITGIYRTKECNDTTLPPIESYGHSRVEALARIRGITVWTEEEWEQVKNDK